MSELKVIKIELNNHGKPIASIQGTTSYYGISPNDTFYPQAEADKVIAELKSENERLKATPEEIAKELYIKMLIYPHNMVRLEDAYRIAVSRRKTKRALWLARAERANEKQQLFHFSLAYNKLCIDGFYNPSSGRRELSPKQWIKVFNKVECKCRAKAEEFK